MDKLKYIKLENEDGSYSDSIPLAVDSDHVDVNGDTLTNELSKKASTNLVNTNISNLQNQINSLASGSPLVASSVAEMTNTSKVYVNTTNGHWYWYNGSSWVDGGVYQATGISDNSITNKYLSQYITGISFNCVVPSNNKNLVIFDILPSKRFFSNEHTIKIKGKYILKSKSFTWSYVSLVVYDPDYYSQQKAIFTINDNTPLNKEIDFESTIPPFNIRNIVKKLLLVYDNSFSNQTSEIEFIDLMIFIDDELYSIGDILLPHLPSYTTTITNSKNYLVDKIMLDNFYNKNKEYSDNNLHIAKNYTDSQINNNLNNFDSSTKSNLHSITCFGDSITEGGANDGKSYPSLLKDYINNENVSVRNCGQSGQLSGAIAIRQGGIKAIVSEAFTIPSTTDEVEISLNFSSSPTNINRSCYWYS